MANDSIIKPFEYSIERTSTGVRLTAHRNVIHFVKEIIPDGQMAGMMGHRPVPGEQEFIFDLYPDQARVLWEELGRALDEGQWHGRRRR